MRFIIVYRKKEYAFRMNSNGQIGRPVGINWTEYILTRAERNAIMKAGGKEEIRNFLENSNEDIKKIGTTRIIKEN